MGIRVNISFIRVSYGDSLFIVDTDLGVVVVVSISTMDGWTCLTIGVGASLRLQELPLYKWTSSSILMLRLDAIYSSSGVILDVIGSIILFLSTILLLSTYLRMDAWQSVRKLGS